MSHVTVLKRWLKVAPLAGARIEITIGQSLMPIIQAVAPLAGARIEITVPGNRDRGRVSLPSRERGLK